MASLANALPSDLALCSSLSGHAAVRKDGEMRGACYTEIVIYVIKALGTDFVKVGVTRGEAIGRRLSTLQIGCPFELSIVALADWPDQVERQLHIYLEPLRERGEWFREGERVSHIMHLMGEPDGLLKFLEIGPDPTRTQRRRGWQSQPKRVKGQIGPKLGSKIK